MRNNEESDRPLEEFLVPKVEVEQYAGIFLWQRLVGRKIEREKKNIRSMWDLSLPNFEQDGFPRIQIEVF
jgi:hypothetical protein